MSYSSGKEKNIFLWEMHEFSRIAIPIHLPAKKNMLFTVKVLVLLLLPIFTLLSKRFLQSLIVRETGHTSLSFSALYSPKDQLKAVVLFKYVWPFSGHQALKD